METLKDLRSIIIKKACSYADLGEFATVQLAIEAISSIDSVNRELQEIGVANTNSDVPEDIEFRAACVKQIHLGNGDLDDLDVLEMEELSPDEAVEFLGLLESSEMDDPARRRSARDQIVRELKQGKFEHGPSSNKGNGGKKTLDAKHLLMVKLGMVTG